jgi:hypothetical protein
LRLIGGLVDEADRSAGQRLAVVGAYRTAESPGRARLSVRCRHTTRRESRKKRGKAKRPVASQFVFPRPQRRLTPGNTAHSGFFGLR